MQQRADSGADLWDWTVRRVCGVPRNRVRRAQKG